VSQENNNNNKKSASRKPISTSVHDSKTSKLPVGICESVWVPSLTYKSTTGHKILNKESQKV
jgi:hypothetical protein